MTAYLISWKPQAENKERGWPTEQLASLAERLKVDGTAREPWRFSRIKDVRLGERVYLVRQGRGGHGILGYGRIASLPSSDTRQADIEFEALVDPNSGAAYASAHELHGLTGQKGVWDTNASGVLLPADVEARLADLVIGRMPIPMRQPARNPDWIRDELILALDLYLRHRPRIPDDKNEEVVELSRTLRRLGEKLFASTERSDKFRNPNGVAMKLMNFRRLDPAYTADGKKGLSAGAKAEEDIWTEFSPDPVRCARVARSIMAAIEDPALGPSAEDVDGDDDMDEAPEGRLLTRSHRVRERNAKLAKRKLAQALRHHGRLMCEACRFDFHEFYGERGQGFLECHHTKPVETLGPGDKTHIDDLVLLCSNCHRMIHRRRPWLTIESLRKLLGARPSITGPT